jgi:spore germination protein YaaH
MPVAPAQAAAQGASESPPAHKSSQPSTVQAPLPAMQISAGLSSSAQPAPVVATQALVPRTSVSGSGPTHEVFGFATAGSLGDPTIGYPSWNFDLLSTVAFFAIHVRYDGQVVEDSNFSVWDSSVLTGLVNTAHAHGVKVVVTIVGPSNPSDLCDALYNRATTISQIVNQVTLKGVDGVNIDYEGQLQTCKNNNPALNQSNQSMITALAHDMRTALAAAGAGNYLSIDTYSGSAAGNDGFFNIPDLANYVDSFFIMAYDMDYYGWKLAGCSRYCMNPVSPLSTYPYNDTTSVTQYSAVAGPGKVILGLPYYGRVACVASPVNHAYPTRAMSAATYAEAASVAQSPDVKPGTFRVHRDSTDPAGLERWDSWYDLSLGCWREMYWDDTTSLATRYNLVNRSNIRGVGFWTLNYGGGAPELWDLLSAYFKVWSAGYDMVQAPTRWVAGQPQTFNVTVTNSGTFTWPSGGTNPVELNLHFTSRSGGSSKISSWLTSQSFVLPADVPPGESATVPVTVRAPMATGSMYLEAEMFKYHQFWLSQWQPIPVTVAAQTWVAGYDMSQAPASWQTGQTKTFTVTLTNKGNMAWPSGGSNPVQLDLHFSAAPGGSANISKWLTSQVYALPADVPPGQSTTVTVAATPPASSGYLDIEAELFKYKQFWFQQWQPLAVTVYGAWGASYDSCQVPTAWAPGQSQTVTLSLTNFGSQTWPAAGANPVQLDLHFATAPGGAAVISKWLTSQTYSLPSDVAPGDTVSVSVTAKAPTTAGSLYLEVQMFKYKQLWFQQWQWSPASVGSLAWGANYNVCGAPRTWAAGQSQTFQVILTNAGSQTWPSGGSNPVELNLHFTNRLGGPVTSWFANYSFALPSDVAPGQAVTVTVTIAGTSATGPMYLEGRLFKYHQFWFGQSLAAAVRVA